MTPSDPQVVLPESQQLIFGIDQTPGSQGSKPGVLTKRRFGKRESKSRTTPRSTGRLIREPTHQMRQVGVIESSKFERTLIHLAGPLENAVSRKFHQCSEPMSAFPPPRPAQPSVRTAATRCPTRVPSRSPWRPEPGNRSSGRRDGRLARARPEAQRAADAVDADARAMIGPAGVQRPGSGRPARGGAVSLLASGRLLGTLVLVRPPAALQPAGSRCHG